MQITKKHANDYMQLEMAYQGIHASYQMEEWVHGLPVTAAQSWLEELLELQVSRCLRQWLNPQTCVPDSQLPS